MFAGAWTIVALTLAAPLVSRQNHEVLMLRPFALAPIALVAAASTAHADAYALPVCYGNNVAVETILRPTGFRSLECKPKAFGQPSCAWSITPSGTRPTHDYLVLAKVPSPPPTSPPPVPPPDDEAFASVGAKAAAPPPARLSWPSGTTIPAFRSSICAPSPDADLDDALGATLLASPSDGGLVFALDAGRARGDAGAPPDDPIVSLAYIGQLGGCQGTLATQQLIDGVWTDRAAYAVGPEPRFYMQYAQLVPGARVRLVLRAVGTCTVRDVTMHVPE
jgi:hypothetical protein